MKKLIYPILISILLGCAEKPRHVVQAQHVEAELVSENESVQPGEPFWVGLRLGMEKNWHINWVNPGDAGLAPTIKWELPEGFSAGEIEWPIPIKLPIDPFMMFGYEDEVLLPVKITPPNSLKSSNPVKLIAHADWVVCSDACIPGKATLGLEIDVRNEPPKKSQLWSAKFETTKSKLPQSSKHWEFDAEISPEKLTILILPLNEDSPEIDRVFFYPIQQGIINNAAEQLLQKEGNGYKLEIERDRMSAVTLDKILGVLVVESKIPEGRSKAGIRLELTLKKIET